MIEVRNFDGDLQEVGNLIKASWKEEYGGTYKQPVMDYSSIDFLEWNLKRPDADPDLLYGAYSDGKLVSFAAGFPHKLRYADQVLRAASTSFFTTHIDYKRKGIGKSLVREALLKGIDKGYEVNTFVPDEGHVVEGFIERLSDEMNLRFLKLNRFTFLSKPLDKAKIMELSDLSFFHKIGLQVFTKRGGVVREKAYGFEPAEDVKVIYRMLNKSYSPNILTVNWEESTLKSQLRGKISNTFFINRNSQKAFINYYTIDLIGCRSVQKLHKMTMIDIVQFENMSFFEKHRFVSDFCVNQKEKGSCIITIPTIPAFDLIPFYSNMFLPTGRYHWYCVHDFHFKLRDNVEVGYLFFR